MEDNAAASGSSLGSGKWKWEMGVVNGSGKWKWKMGVENGEWKMGSGNGRKKRMAPTSDAILFVLS